MANTYNFFGFVPTFYIYRLCQIESKIKFYFEK